MRSAEAMSGRCSSKSAGKIEGREGQHQPAEDEGDAPHCPHGGVREGLRMKPLALDLHQHAPCQRRDHHRDRRRSQRRERDRGNAFHADDVVKRLGLLLDGRQHR